MVHVIYSYPPPAVLCKKESIYAVIMVHFIFILTILEKNCSRLKFFIKFGLSGPILWTMVVVARSRICIDLSITT